MNRNEFMGQLENLLQNISPTEREEALQYYNDYFDDAGVENEQDVIEALGNPARVAENIKKDLCANGYGDSFCQRVSPNDKVIVPYGHTEAAESAQADEVNGIIHGGQNTGQNGSDNMLHHSAYAQEKNSGSKLSGGMIALIVILCVLASPIILSLASGILGTLIGIIVAWFAVIFGFGVATLALVVVFVVLMGVGISCIFADPLVGIALIGGGMLCGGLGILFLMLTVTMAGIATPTICRGVLGFMRKLFCKKEVRTAC